ncbi:hypothetical protein BJ508DRAFT_417789 [Ascobolus immersus RN42]|uniref:Uncharacterized protein n=1 Tax=Ascobolus immersus RN42 TaxID=1160509 RepID=A0A3N4HTZ3_ASCIM|nr:hypothetical protein BJ508DRAFT_417789 [Ascobolus immersus RN42]
MDSFLSDILKRRRDPVPPPTAISFTLSAFSKLPTEIHLQIIDELALKDIINMTSLSFYHPIGYVYEDIFISRIKADVLKTKKTSEYREGGYPVNLTGSDGNILQLSALIPLCSTVTRIIDLYYQHYDGQEVALPFLILDFALTRSRADLVKLVADRLGPQQLNSMAGTSLCPLMTVLSANFYEGLEVLAACGLDLVSKRKTVQKYNYNNDGADTHFCTPLHLAVRFGHKTMVEAILRLGGNAIDIHERDSNGQTAIGVATSLWLLNPSEFDIPRDWEEYWGNDSTFGRRIAVIDSLLTVGGANLHRAGAESILERAWNDARSPGGVYNNLNVYFKVFVERMLPLLRERGLRVRVQDIKNLKQRREGGECIDWSRISGAEELSDLGEKALRIILRTLELEEAQDE